MSDLLKKDAEWNLPKAEIDAYTEEKKLLVESPVLDLLDADMPLSVVCDLSNFAIETALLHKNDDGIDCVILHQLHILKAAELN
uniref:Uncharacterized protein n=1 Tax=Hyaloperonospora arabidopsidis (strain Emoy2) TaxID=559515 RepID=M4BF32_HYAAE